MERTGLAAGPAGAVEVGGQELAVEPAPSAPAVGAPAYGRVLLKLSGEVFGGGAVGVDPLVVRSIARQIAAVVRAGT